MSTLFMYFGFVAFSFAYENIALNKPAYQQYPYTGPGPAGHLTEASNAVDGLKSNLSVWGGQCVISEYEKQTATWWVDLTSIVSIHHITIYYRTEAYGWIPHSDFPARFLGFSLYVSNTKEKTQGTLCFKDSNFTLNTIPAVFNTTCFTQGQYVIFYNERLKEVKYPDGYSQFAFNDLCEVEVYGCPIPGFYGSNCSIPCPDPHCLYCHIETSTCHDCKPGYTGHRCLLECLSGKFGNECANSCGHCIDVSHCHHVNGMCSSGCKPGYKGLYCTQTCEIGLYGDQCKENCGHCQNQSSCLHTNGLCEFGCDYGYRGDLCKTPCEAGTYGHRCEEKCGQCKDLSKCLHTNGLCLTGCQEGYHGDLCRIRFISEDRRSSSNWQSSFYGVLVVLLISLISIGLLILYIIKLRKCKKFTPQNYQPSEYTNNSTTNNDVNERERSNVNIAYVNLGDIRNNQTSYESPDYI